MKIIAKKNSSARFIGISLPSIDHVFFIPVQQHGREDIQAEIYSKQTSRTILEHFFGLMNLRWFSLLLDGWNSAFKKKGIY